jgi:outer membrane protein assembly factor BamB
LNSKVKWHLGRITLLAVMVITIGAAAFGCISGITAKGWSGGAVSDNVIFVGTMEGRLVALNLIDDGRKWSEPLKAAGSGAVAIYGTPVFEGELVYIAGYNGKIYAYNTATLSVRWVYPREGYLPPIVGGLIVNNGKLFVGVSSGTIDGEKVKGRVYALDATTGDPLWNFDTGDKIWATPAISDGTLYIGSFDKKLYALNTADGTKKWEFATGGSIMSTPLIYNNTLYFGSLDRYFYAVNMADQSLKWKVMSDKGFWAEPVVADGKIFVGGLDNNAYVFKVDTGELLAAIDMKSPIASKPVLVDNSVIFANRKGLVYSVNTASYQVAELANLKVEVNASLTARNGIVYIHALDASLHRININNGNILPTISLAKPK